MWVIMASLCLLFDEYACALDGIDETVGYLIDVGHANINGWDVPTLIRRVAPRLYGLHIHDNNGNSDQHLPIGDGTMEWNQSMKLCGKCRKPVNLFWNIHRELR